jgi:ABC-type multidrug transport system fused ATPase/permease subunit
VLDHPLDVTEQPSAHAIGTADGALGFDGVTFAYPGTRRPALSEVSFDVQPGQLVALVGPSGAGKTTATYLLTGFHDPTAGSVMLDGVDLRDLTLESLSSQIAIVFQDTFLFSRQRSRQPAVRTANGNAARARSGRAGPADSRVHRGTA